MALTKTTTADNVINRAAVEIGLVPVVDPYSSEDEAYRQLTYLLNTAGEELCMLYEWEFLNKKHQIITSSADSGEYPLPDDFLFMVNQTGWERANAVPLFGPLSPQDWTYLEGRDLVSQTIYATFRIQEGQFTIFPQPPPDNLDVNFEYQCKNWVLADDNAGGTIPADEATQSSDVILFDKVLISRYLKLKFMEAKGFDTMKAQDDFYQYFSLVTGREKGAEILRAGGQGRGFPYLDGYRNVGDTGYGQ